MASANPDYAELADTIKAWGHDAGFQAVGIADVDLAPHDERFRSWLARRFQGDMTYLERNVDARLEPDRLLPGTLRVIVARMNYAQPESQPIRVLADPELGYVARYALGRDYHKVMRRRLARLARRIHDAAGSCGPYRAFVDSAPVLEKALGEKAGLGWMGKNTLLLDSDDGSWFFLGEIYTSLPLPVDEAVGDKCGSCRACMTVCPTQAIVAPRQLDARRCISYLTIEHRGSIPEPLRPLMGNRIFGCDDCQLWCPWNRTGGSTREADFSPRHDLDAPELVALFGWSTETFERNTRGSALRRITHEQWLRNIAVALGNGPPSDAAFNALSARADHPSALVREHVAWALKSLRNRPDA